MTAAENTVSLSERLIPPAVDGQRDFGLALLVAFLCHVALLVETGRSVPRTLGSPDGQPDAISVELVSEADLKSRETVALPPPGGAPPAAAPQPPPAEAAPAQPPAQPATEAETAPQAPPQQEQQQQTEQQQKPQQPSEGVELPELLKKLPDLAALAKAAPSAEPAETQKSATFKLVEPKSEAKSEPAKPDETRPPPEPSAQKKPAPQARLDLSLPQPRDELVAVGPGLAAVATRPPGITRSGANDAFGHAVVRALRATMPPPGGILGRVTVRLLLTQNGDLADVRVLESSGRRRLDQAVVFATRQTYFPLPPLRSTVADRTFTIRYIYR